MKDILVIGESCKDIFIYCDVIKLCPDVPIPVLSVLNKTENSGMAKNVQQNILTKVKNCDIITNNNWKTITKTRYMHEKTNHAFFRVDTSHVMEPLDLDTIDYNYKIVVISDYNKGFLSEDAIETICANHNLVFIDTKKILGKWVNKCKFIKINNYEYNNSKSRLTPILKNKIIHTDGENGCYFKNKNYPVARAEIKDTSGAGDSFMASLVVKYLETSDINKSIVYANQCASEVVKHRGVSLI